LHSDNQLDAAEEVAFRTIDILPERGEHFRICGAHRLLGEIYRSKGDTEKAIYHFELSIRIASTFDWHDHLFWAHFKLAALFRDEGRFDDAHDHIEHAKLYMVDSAYKLGYAMEEQARILYKQHRLEESKSGALRAAEVYGKLGAAKDVEDCRKLLQWIEEDMDSPVASDQSDLNCELL
jgi:tetratricopeptide (TPR) repeat protein